MRAGMLSLMLSCFGHRRVTKAFLRRGRKVKGKPKKSTWQAEVGEEPEFWPSEWRDNVPSERDLMTAYCYGTHPRGRQWIYNVSDLETPIYIVLLKVLCVLLANQEENYHGGPINHKLLLLCLNENIGRTFQEYDGCLSRNVHADQWPRLGESCQLAEVPYMGTDRSQMPDPDKEKFGPRMYREYWASRPALTRTSRGVTALRARLGPKVSSSDEDRGPGLSSSDDWEQEDAETRAERLEKVRSRILATTGGSVYDRLGPPVDVAGNDLETRKVTVDNGRAPVQVWQVPRDPFFQFALGPDCEHLSEAEKAAIIRGARKEAGDKFWTDPFNRWRHNTPAPQHAVYVGFCEACGTRAHLDIQLPQYRCDPSKLYCKNPLCSSPGGHTERVCKDLFLPCKECGLRGHGQKPCENTKEARQNTAWNFETFADDHVLARRRLVNVYYGFAHFKQSAFRTLKPSSLVWNWRNKGDELLDHQLLTSLDDPGDITELLAKFVQHREQAGHEFNMRRQEQAKLRRLEKFGHSRKRQAKFLAFVAHQAAYGGHHGGHQGHRGHGGHRGGHRGRGGQRGGHV